MQFESFLNLPDELHHATLLVFCGKLNTKESELASIYDELAYEFVLMTRYSVQNLPWIGRENAMDRSALLLLARLEGSGPMSVAELADAFELNTSTVHRQLKAALSNGLIELIDDPSGAPAKLHRPTDEGRRQLRKEMQERAESHAATTADWSDEDVETFARLFRRYNQASEARRGRPWPRND